MAPFSGSKNRADKQTDTLIRFSVAFQPPDACARGLPLPLWRAGCYTDASLHGLRIMQHRDRFLALDRLLHQHRALWQFRPFAQLEVPWSDQYPELAAWLVQWSEAEIQASEAEPERWSDAVAAVFPAIRELPALSELPAAPLSPLSPDARLDHGVPGRKWQQLLAFVQAIAPRQAPVLEWCAGKAHLGRLAGASWKVPVRSLELDPVLCEEGRLLAARQGTAQEVVAVDVLSPAVESWLDPQQQALALHACGDLHLQLLQLASRHRLAAIHLSPCCYHRTQDDLYQPLSRTAQASALRLDRQDRQLAVQETVTAGQRVRRLRDQEVSWRLGFDSLQRQVRGMDAYLPVPNAPKQLLSGSFEHFCQWAAQSRQLVLPTRIDLAAFEQAGWQRLHQVRRLERVSQLFRRPLELWLALDRALFLEENGYEVGLTEFCDARLTPRNLLLQATLMVPG